MQRTVVAEIFGYLVCLLAVVIFFAGAAGIVSSAFRIAHPTPRPPAMMQHFVAGRSEGFPGGPMIRAPQPSNVLPAPPGVNAPFVTARLIADERYDATRRFVVAVVMLILSVAVFNRAFGWLNPKPGSAT
jgi:hypothetical protein